MNIIIRPSLSERLHEAYDLADVITRQHSASFYFSSGLLPSEKRRAARALYAYCRASDELVDAEYAQASDLHSARLHALDIWQEEVDRPIQEQDNPILLAWADTRGRYDIPLHYSIDLLDGMRMDLDKMRYETFDDLWTYCYRAASVVGINSMYITGYLDQPETFRRAELLGVALQLTNILRDVGEDLSRGRIYLPQEDLRAFAVTEDDLASGVVTENYRALMQRQIERAHLLYEQAWPGIGMLHADGRLAIAAAAEVYRGILGRIEANDYDNFSQRAYVPTRSKLAMLPGIWWRLRAFDGKDAPRLEAVPLTQLNALGLYARYH